MVFIECTFFQPDHKDAAAGSQHLHWRYSRLSSSLSFSSSFSFSFSFSVRLTVPPPHQCSDLRPFALEHRDTTFILIHFSKRYSDDEIYAFFDNERTTQRELEAAEDGDGGCPKRRPAFDNVVVWLAGLGQHGAAKSAGAGAVGE